MDKEKRVYILHCDGNFDFREAERNSDEEAIKKEAEARGTVYSLKGFQNALNDEELSLDNAFILID